MRYNKGMVDALEQIRDIGAEQEHMGLAASQSKKPIPTKGKVVFQPVRVGLDAQRNLESTIISKKQQ